MFTQQIKQTSQKEFDYNEFWALQEPQKKAHKQRADECGLIDKDDLPVAPTLHIIGKSRDITEEMSEEELISWGEVQRQVLMKDIEPLLAIPQIESSFVDLRQMEDGIDVSVFNTVDFLREHKLEFDKKRYAMNKIIERAKDLALLHSCVGSEWSKEHVKQRFEALVNTSFRKGALYLATVKFPIATDEERAEIKQKIGECNRNIIKLMMIWKKFSFS